MIIFYWLLCFLVVCFIVCDWLIVLCSFTFDLVFSFVLIFICCFVFVCFDCAVLVLLCCLRVYWCFRLLVTCRFCFCLLVCCGYFVL